MSTSCGTTIAHRNQLFRLHQQNKYSVSQTKFSPDCDHCYRILDTDKLAYNNKRKRPLLPGDFDLATFDEMLIVFSTKVNLQSPTVLKCCLLQ